jgi:carboxylesterase
LLCGTEKKPGAGGGETSRDIAPWKGYGGPLHIRQLLSLRRGCAATRALLPGLRAPLLVIQDERDRLVYQGNARAIAGRTATPDPSLILTRIRESVTRHHMITTHRETKDFVAGKIIGFLRGKKLDHEGDFRICCEHVPFYPKRAGG